MSNNFGNQPQSNGNRSDPGSNGQAPNRPAGSLLRDYARQSSQVSPQYNKEEREGPRRGFSRHRTPFLLFLIVALLVLVGGVSFATLHQTGAQAASPVIQQISHDPFTNSTSQHHTQVEPDTFSSGSTVVSAFQSGRFYAGGGSSGISWATSTNAGLTWQGGTLPGITVYTGGSYARVSDPAVAHDAAHGTWLIASLAAKTTFDGVNGSTAVIVSRSTNGGLTWNKPVLVAASGSSNNFDKDWIVCDQHPASPFYGRCYAEWDDAANHGRIFMSFSTNGGLTWSRPVSPTSQSFSAIGGQPLVMPNGYVIVPIYGYDLATGAEGLYSYRSTNGGASWTNLLKIARSTYSAASAFYRGGSLPSADIDHAGKVYLAWAGCYFEPKCMADDIVLTTTTDGLTWAPLQRIPLDAVGSGVEHITAGLAVDSSTSGSGAHLAVTYYYWPHAGCSASTCQISVGFASSINGGATWSQHQTLAGPMLATWWANTNQGYMTGDYIATAISPSTHLAVTVFPVARAPSGQTRNEFMEGASLSVTGGTLRLFALNLAGTAPQGTYTKHYRTAH
ncbi:MAG TPA: sialidase family protein [Ktedonobacteraceae bacterium]